MADKTPSKEVQESRKEDSLEKLLLNYAAARRYELTARALKRAKEIRKKEADGTPDLQDLIQIALREVLEEEAEKTKNESEN